MDWKIHYCLFVFFYLFLAVLVLLLHAGFILAVAGGGCSLAAMGTGFSQSLLRAEHGLWTRRTQWLKGVDSVAAVYTVESSGPVAAQAWFPRGLWNLPRPRVGTVSPHQT